MKIRYEITQVDNAKDLPDYVPVTGRWSAYVSTWREKWDFGANGKFAPPSKVSVIETVCNWMDADFPIRVQLFHADGREITGEMPWDGAFVATRE